MKAIQLKLGADVIVLQRTTGGADVGDGRMVRFGLAGAADLHGYVAGGRGFEIEAKTQTGKLDEQQLAWAERCRKLKVPWLMVHAGSEQELDTAAASAANWVADLLERKNEAVV